MRDDRSVPAGGGDRGLPDRLAGLSFRLIQLEQQLSTDGKVRELRRCLSEMRHIQRELERATRDLRDDSSRQQWLVEQAERSAARTALVLDLMPLAVVMVGADGIVTEANRAAVDLLNLSHRHLLGRSIVLFLGGNRESFLSGLTQIVEGRVEVLRLDVTLRPRERRPLEVGVSAAASDDRQVVLVFGHTGVHAAAAPAGLFHAPGHAPAGGATGARD